MTTTQKIIKYCAIAFAIFLIFSIISGVAALIGSIGGAFSNVDINEELKDLHLENNANVLDINIKATNLEIKKGNILKAETDNEHITINNTNNRLVIKEEKHNLFDTDTKKLTVYVPEDLVFEGVSINAGAGNIKVEELNSDNLFMDLGAGNVTIDNVLVTKEIEIDGGAGNLTIENGSMNNLDLDLGVGDVSVTANLQGDIDINTGVGKTEVNILGNKEDYEIEVDKGFGKVTIDGIDVKDEYTFGRGINSIDIDGGIGNINVNFRLNK